jgi:hypothetical protein
MSIALNGGPAIQVHRGHLVLRQLRDAGRSRHVLGKLSEGGEQRPCGWLKDKFGLSSWQVNPRSLVHRPAGKLVGPVGPPAHVLVSSTMIAANGILANGGTPS